MKPSPSTNIRYQAARIVFNVAEQGQSFNTVYQQALNKIDDQQAGLLQELSAGTIRWYVYLNGCIKPLLTKSLKDKDQDIYALLLVGAYQLLFTEKPDYAALSETVEGCRLFKKPWATKLVNGVLRNLQRQKDERIEALAQWQTQAHPRWLNKRLTKAWGEELAADIMAANNERPPMCLRVNQQRQTRDTLLEQLKTAGIAAKATVFADTGIRLAERIHPSQIEGFSDGNFSVQDEAAQLCAAILNPQAGDRVLDACAAPGGKTGHLLEHQTDIAELVALDIDDDRLGRVEENLERLDLEATLMPADASCVEDWWDEQPFDRILLDAPCSGTGVIRRHPDIKLLRQSEDIAKLVELQQTLLSQLWKTLKPGGSLLYATCSVLPEENAEQMKAFLAQTDDAEYVTIAAKTEPKDTQVWGIDTGFGRQLLPSHNGPDGFFYCLLKKGTSLL